AVGGGEVVGGGGDRVARGGEGGPGGGAAAAAHPHEVREFYATSFSLGNRRKVVSKLVDLWEVACRWDLFPVVSREKLPHVASSDFHRPEHLYAWKTLLPAQKNPASVLEALRRGSGIGLIRLEESREAAA